MDIITIIFQIINIAKRLFETFIILSANAGHILCQIIAVLVQLLYHIIKCICCGFADFQCFIENLPCAIGEILCIARYGTNYCCYLCLNYINAMLQMLESFSNAATLFLANVCYCFSNTVHYVLVILYTGILLIFDIFQNLLWPVFLCAILLVVCYNGVRLLRWSLRIVLVVIYMLIILLRECIKMALLCPTKIRSKLQRFFENTEKKTTSDNLACVVCYERPKQVLLLPCRHVCLCETCAQSNEVLMSCCPLCRKIVIHKLSVYV